MADQVLGASRPSETVRPEGESPRRDFMEKVGLIAGGLLVAGSSTAARAAEGAQGGAAPSDRPIVELAGLKPEHIATLSPVAKKLSHSDLLALAKVQKSAGLSGLTVGDIKSLNDALFDAAAVIPAEGGPAIRVRPSCCCCCCTPVLE